MKKILFSLAICAGVAFANPLPVDKPKEVDMLSLLGESRDKIKQKNPMASVYVHSVGVDATPDDAQYYDYLMSAYNQAVLELKAQVILRKVGEVAFRETLDYYNKTMPEDLRDEKLKAKADSMISEIEKGRNPDGFFALIGEVLKKIAGVEGKKDDINVKIQEDIFNKAMMEGFTKNSSDEISGLVPVEAIIAINEDGSVELGVVAYTTKNSIQLAKDLRQGHPSKKTSKQEQCIKAENIANKLSNDELLSSFGIKYFYNENCRPSLLAYGMDSFIGESGMNADYRAESLERARAMADKFISNFLSSNVNAFIKDSKSAQKTKKAIIDATKKEGKTGYKITKKGPRSAIIKEMTKEFSSDSSMQLIGLEDARTWSINRGDYTVVGVARYYSMDSINAAHKEFNPDLQENHENHKENTKTYKSKVIRSNNLDVDDF